MTGDKDQVPAESYLKSIALGIGILTTVVVGWVLSATEALIVPVVLGALLAFLLDGISGQLARIPLYSRLFPSWMKLATTAIVLFLIMLLGVGFFARNLEAVVRALPQYVETFSAVVADVASRFDVEVELTWYSVNKIISNTVNLQDVVRYSLNSLSYTAGYMALVFMYAILFLLEQNSLKAKIAAIFPDNEKRSDVWFTIDAIISQIGTYFTTKTLINVVLGILCYGIFVVFGVEFAAFFAVLTAIFNYIPYVGSWVAMALPMLFALGQFGLSVNLLFLFLCLSAAQLGLGYFWEPRLMGKTLNISPVVVLFSLAVWTAVWGLVGAILSVILTSGIMTVMCLFDTTRPLAILLTNTGEPPVPSPESRKNDRNVQTQSG